MGREGADESPVGHARLHHVQREVRPLLAAEPAARRQPLPDWLCGGRIKEARNSSTWAMLHHHFVTRLGAAAALPNVSALLPQIRANIACWDQGCWEALTHS